MLEAVQYTEEGKRLKAANLEVPKKEITRAEIANLEEASWLPDVDRVEAVRKLKPVQKTGIICPKCHRKTDSVIWGVHKKKVAQSSGD